MTESYELAPKHYFDFTIMLIRLNLWQDLL